MQLVHSAFLASAAANSNLTHHILPPRFHLRELSYVKEARTLCSEGLDLPSPAGPDSCRQKVWDTPKVATTADKLLKQAQMQ